MRLYFSPSKPSQGIFALTKMMHLIGVERLSYTNPEEANGHPTVLWIGDTTFAKPSRTPDRAINFNCTNISKTHVSTIFQMVFGYSLSVDPTTHKGFMVEKAEENAAHDGRVVKGPLTAAKPNRVYQVLVDSSENEIITDIRVPIIGNKIPLVYLKRRHEEIRFSNENASVAITTASSVFSMNEIASIRSFARAIGMDYGELDIIRDKDSRKIYIVDANKTPLGPPNHIDEKDGFSALRTMAGAFKEQFIDGKYWLA